MKLKNCVRSALDQDELNIIYLGLDKHIYDLWDTYPLLNIYMAANLEGVKTNYDPTIAYDFILVDDERFIKQSHQAMKSEGIPVIYLAKDKPSKKTAGYITKHRQFHIHEVVASTPELAKLWYTDKLININNLKEAHECLKKLLPVVKDAYFRRTPEILRLDVQRAS